MEGGDHFVRGRSSGESGQGGRDGHEAASEKATGRVTELLKRSDELPWRLRRAEGQSQIIGQREEEGMGTAWVSGTRPSKNGKEDLKGEGQERPRGGGDTFFSRNYLRKCFRRLGVGIKRRQTSNRTGLHPLGGERK